MRILAATDGSETANHAVELAAQLTKNLTGRLEIIHVYSDRDVPEEQLRDYTTSAHMSSAEILVELSDEMLRVARERAEKFGVSDIQSSSLLEIAAGATAETILDAAQRNATDIIVIG